MSIAITTFIVLLLYCALICFTSNLDRNGRKHCASMVGIVGSVLIGLILYVLL